MTLFALLGINFLLSTQIHPIDVALTPAQITAKSTFRISYNRGRLTANLAQLKGYRLPSGTKATRAGIVFLAGKRVVVYGVQERNSQQLAEIGLDLDHNKVFDRSEVATLSGKSSSYAGGMVYAFRDNPNPLVFVTAAGIDSIEVSPARLMRGSAAFGDKTLQFTVGDADFDGKFGKNDMVCWAYRQVRSQSLSSLFAMPDGRYYAASLPSQSLLRFIPDERPIGIVRIKNGELEAGDIRLNGNRFEPILKEGSILLPEGDYFLNSLLYSTTGKNGAPSYIGVYGSLKPYRVAGNKNLILDPGPINRVGLRVRKSPKAVSLQLEAFTKNGYAVADLTLQNGNTASRPPAPMVEIINPSGAVVGHVNLKYG